MFSETNTKINLNDLFRAKGEIDGADRILLITHKNPDDDAIGSMTAVMDYLKTLDKKYTAFCFDEVPENLAYLKYSYEIISDIKELKNTEFDLIISLDCADMKYSGIEDYLADFIAQGLMIINIDHHLGSDYGEINIVDGTASSTSLILCDIFKIWKVAINKETATSLLAGILYDTNSFSNTSTNIKTMEMAAELIRMGGRYGYINRRLYKNKSRDWLRLKSRVLSRLLKNDKLKVAYSVIVLEDIKEFESENFDGMANFFNHLNEVKVAMILKEDQDGEIKISLRSIDGQVDVAKLAKFFGGGGHKKAAGFTVRGRIEQEKGYWKIV